MGTKTMGLLGATGTLLGFVGVERFLDTQGVAQVFGLWIVSSFLLSLVSIYGIKKKDRFTEAFSYFVVYSFSFSFAGLVTMTIGSSMRTPGVAGIVEVITLYVIYASLGLLVGRLTLQDKMFSNFPKHN